MRVALAGTLLVAATALLGRPLAAQEALDLSILNAGKPPATPVQVSVVQDGVARPVGTTGADGTLPVPYASATIPAGTTVHVRGCPDENTIRLVPAGERDPRCGEGERDECRCRDLGTFVWGRTASLTVDPTRPAAVAAGGVAAGVGTSPTRTMPAWSFGGSLHYNIFNKVEDVAADAPGTVGANADASGLGFGLNVTYRRPGLPVALRAGYEYGSYSVETFGPSFIRSNADVSVNEIYAEVGYPLRLGSPFGVSLWGGFSMLFNSVDIETEYGSGLESDDRSESGLRFRLGGDITYPLTDKLSLRGLLRYKVGDSDDADTHMQFGAGLQYSLGGF